MKHIIHEKKHDEKCSMSRIKVYREKAKQQQRHQQTVFSANFIEQSEYI